MQTGLITENSIEFFREYFTDEIKERIDNEEPTVLIGLYDDEYALGALGGYLEEDIFYICSIYVASDYRRMGGGRLMMLELFNVLQDMPVMIMAEFMLGESYDDSIAAFFEKLSFIYDEEDMQGVYMISLDMLLNNPLLNEDRYEEIEKKILPFQDIKEEVLLKAQEYADANLIPIPEAGILAESIDREASMAHLDKLGRVDAYLIIDNSMDFLPTVAALWNGTNDPRILAGLIRKATHMLTLSYPKEIEITFTIVNEASLAIVKKLTPKAKRVSYRFFTFNS